MTGVSQDTNAATVVGCILAGGLSTRMQGPEKTLMLLGDKPMIDQVIRRLGSQVDTMVINANGDPERFAFTGLSVQADIVEGFAGPLAGVHAGMEWATHNEQAATHLLTVAGDTPFFPNNLSKCLMKAVKAQSSVAEETIALAYSDQNRHPTFGIWPIALKDKLEAFLKAGDRKVMLFAQKHNLQKVDFPLIEKNQERFDPFFNINTPEDIAMAEALMGEYE